ncbi:MAG: hypothetical protein IPL33_05335 [Sphingobacteriales bacterium]|nr:hypothetical protein [Sphingobacteriales bacterium]
MTATAVHEVGHYLGLRHIWGDGDCTQDDGIDDTPDADAQNRCNCRLRSQPKYLYGSHRPAIARYV